MEGRGGFGGAPSGDQGGVGRGQSLHHTVWPNIVCMVSEEIRRRNRRGREEACLICHQKYDFAGNNMEHNLFHWCMAHHASEHIDVAAWQAMVRYPFRLQSGAKRIDQQLCYLGSLLQVWENAADVGMVMGCRRAIEPPVRFEAGKPSSRQCGWEQSGHRAGSAEATQSGHRAGCADATQSGRRAGRAVVRMRAGGPSSRQSRCEAVGPSSRQCGTDDVVEATISEAAPPAVRPVGGHRKRYHVRPVHERVVLA